MTTNILAESTINKSEFLCTRIGDEFGRTDGLSTVVDTIKTVGGGMHPKYNYCMTYMNVRICI